MKYLSKRFAAVVLFLLLCSFTASPVFARNQAIDTEPSFEAIDRYVEAEMKAVRIPGLALAVVHGDRIVHLKGFGVADPSGQPVTPQTPFNIGSVSKAFTALAVMQLVEAGEVELEAPVVRYLPWFRVANPEASARLRIVDLLNHTSGLPMYVGNDYPDQEDASEAALELRVRALAGAQINRPVSTRYEYSNANYDILGLVVQVVSGQPYEAYIRDHIFTPLDMHNSFTSRLEAEPGSPATGYRMWLGFPLPFREPVPRPHLPSGNQFSSAEDLAHLLIAHLNAGRYQETSVLAETGIQAMRNQAVPSGPDCATYSLHWTHGSRCDSDLLGLGGDTANFKARILLSPGDRWAVAVLMNTQAIGINGPRQDRIEDGVLRLLLGKPPVEASPHNAPVVAGFGFIATVTAVLALDTVRSLPQLRNESPLSLRKGRRPVIPLILDVLWLTLLSGMVHAAVGPRSTQPLMFILENIPDLGWLVLLSGALALVWGSLRTLLALRSRASIPLADELVHQARPGIRMRNS